jgi:hypothetical protein
LHDAIHGNLGADDNLPHGFLLVWSNDDPAGSSLA